MGVKVVTVKLQDVNPPDTVKPSFNEVNEAKQEQEKAINQAERAYNKIIPEARGKAQQLITEAEGYALALVNKAEGDADKFTSEYRAFRKSPVITKKRLYLDAMESVYSSLDDITIVDSAIKGMLQFFRQRKLGSN